MKNDLTTEYVLLGSVFSGPMHGYDILQFTRSALGTTWYVGTSQMYLLLKRLEQKGLLESSVEPQTNRPSKRIFSLTSLGENAFLSWLNSPTKHIRSIRTEFMIKLFFFYRHNFNGGLKLIESQIKVLEEIRERIKNQQKSVENPYTDMVLEFKTITVEAWLKWLRKEARAFMRKVCGYGQTL